jgi:RimJ/RimL family protein N-acetyltransferase
MQHAFRLRGAAFGLRPVEMDDAAFIVDLRTDSRTARFIHRISSRLEDQQAWLQAYFARPGDYYFVVEQLATGAAQGTVGLYDEDRTARSAEWGRWVLRPGSLAAVESALLIYRLAFEVLELDLVYCRTVVANEQVLSFHDSTGLVRHARLPAHATIDSIPHDAVEHRMTRADWARHGEALAQKAAAVARIVARSDKNAPPAGLPADRTKGT